MFLTVIKIGTIATYIVGICLKLCELLYIKRFRNFHFMQTFTVAFLLQISF